MLRPAVIEFGPFRAGQLKSPFAAGIAETLPQRNREFNPIACRQLQEFRKGTRRHALIFARGGIPVIL